jgi:hypothetical protein
MEQRTIARFWSKIEPNSPVPEYAPDLGPCWVWQGAPGENGYGYFWYDDKKRLAHRFSFELFIGPIPDGLTLDHLCRVTMCVHPRHLEPVTDRVNILRGTGPGARNALATECAYGHPFDTENTYWYPNGDRGCRACIRRWRKEQGDKNRTGAGKGGHQRAKTHCPQGHEYTPENTYVQPGGGRQCRICIRIRNRENMRAKRAAAKAAATAAQA